MCEEILQDNDFPCRETANRLGVERVEDLVFVRNNLRLHSQRNGISSSSSVQSEAAHPKLKSGRALFVIKRRQYIVFMTHCDRLCASSVLLLLKVLEPETRATTEAC
jgi:hypothetical protein